MKKTPTKKGAKVARTSTTRNKRKQPLGWRQRMFATRFGKPVIFALAFAVLGGLITYAAMAATAAPSGRVVGLGGKCLDIKYNQRHDGNDVWMWNCNGSTAQNWTINSNGTISNNGKCLDVKGVGRAPRTPVGIWGCVNNAAQIWQPQANGTLKNPNSGLCLDVQWGKAYDGTPIWLWPCDGNPAQVWNLPKAATTPSNPTPAPAPTPTPAPAPNPAPSPTPTTPTPNNPSPASPSGQAMPVGDLPGWKQIFTDDFTKAAATGTWGSECDANRIAYTGAQGQKWRSYPKCFTDTYQKRPYRADKVLSVHDGMMDFFLRPVDGKPAGANPSPVINGDSQYQTYGRYTTRFKVTNASLKEYYVAWLLWPQTERWPDDGEEDFPEGSLAGTAGGFHHYVAPGACVGCQDGARDIGARFTDWHTYTIEWTPGRVKYILDNTVVLDSTKYVPTKPMRWQLQTETNGNGSNQGNLLVDWVSVYKYNK